MFQRFRQPAIFILTGFISYFFNCHRIIAQEYSWKYYSVAEGLPQSQVYKIYQDSRGYLWICTKGGLSKFDGIDFENFTLKDGLDANFVQFLHEDTTGTFYIATRQGVNVLKDGEISSLPMFKDKIVRYFFVDNNSCICTLTDPYELIFVKDGKRIEDHPLVNYIEKGDGFHLSKNEITGEILINTNKNDTFLWDGPSIKKLQKKIKKLNFYFGREGGLYGVTPDSLYIIEREEFKPLFSLRNLSLRFINSSNDIYLFDKDTHSYLYHYDGKSISKFHKKFNKITAVYVDDEKNLWVGTESGLWRLITKGFQNYLADPNNNYYTWMVLQDKDDNYWFGSFLYGLKKFNGIKFTDYPVDHLFRSGEFQKFYSGGIKDKNGNLLFSAFKGVIKYNGRIFDWFYHDDGETIVYIYDDRKNDKLYLSGAKKGIIEFDNKRNMVYLNHRDVKQNTGLVTSIVKDKYDRLWIGGKLGISFRENGEWQNFSETDDGIAIGAISMIRDLKGNLWFGSGQGLYLYDYKQLRKIVPDVFDEQIGVLNFAKSGELLIGSIHGVGLLDLNEFYETGKESVRYFNAENGFLGTECKHNSSFNDNKGNTWICTSDRVVKVNTDELKLNRNSPRVYIKSISTLSDNMQWQPVVKINKNDTVYRFNPVHNDIRFNYHGISHAAPTGVVYQTMLKGYDKEWSAISKERYRTYTNLPHGQYTFKVKAANIDGVWSVNIAGINVEIKPAWHELLPVRVGGLVFLLFIAGGTGYFYSGYKRREKARVEKNEKKIAGLQFKSVIGLIDPHFTFNALNSIASMVYKENRDEAYKYFTKFSKLIRTAVYDSGQTTRTIKEELTFVSDYLDIEKMRFKERFDYTIKLESNVNYDWVIPKMIIQIYVENAVKHGLMGKESGGKLDIFLGIERKKLVIKVRDNGVGRKVSKRKKSKADSLGKGTKIFHSYFDLLNKYNQEKIEALIVDLTDAHGHSAGTQVTIYLPLNYKYNI